MRTNREADYRMSDHEKKLCGLAVSRPLGRGKLRKQHRETIGLLRHADFFAEMSDTELSALDGFVREFRFPAKWTIQAQGTTVENCFVIIEGSATEYDHGTAVRAIGYGSIIGLADAASGHQSRTTVVSEQPLSGIAVNAQALLALMGTTKRPEAQRSPLWAGVLTGSSPATS